MSRVRRAACVLGAAALMSVPAIPASAEDKGVNTTADNQFNPAAVTVDVGDTVTWTNPPVTGGLNHTVTSTSNNTSDWADFDAALTAPNATASFTFEKAGVYKYQCSTHGPQMAGQVTVKSTTKPSPKPSRTTSPPRTSAPATTPPATQSASPQPSSANATPVLPGTTIPPGPSSSNALPSLAQKFWYGAIGAGD